MTIVMLQVTPHNLSYGVSAFTWNLPAQNSSPEDLECLKVRWSTLQGAVYQGGRCEFLPHGIVYLPGTQLQMACSVTQRSAPESNGTGSVRLCVCVYTHTYLCHHTIHIKFSPYDPTIPLLGIHPEKTKTVMWKDTFTSMFIAVLFTVTKIWKQWKCPTNGWIKKIHI